MPSGDELTAEVQRLPEPDRKAVHEAVSNGRAVQEERLAPLAANWAVARRQHLALLCFGILGPVGLLTWWVVDWLIRRDDPDQSGVAVLVGAYLVFGAVSLLMWVLMWRPLVEAQKANLEARRCQPTACHTGCIRVAQRLGPRLHDWVGHPAGTGRNPGLARPSGHHPGVSPGLGHQVEVRQASSRSLSGPTTKRLHRAGACTPRRQPSRRWDGCCRTGDVRPRREGYRATG